MRELIIDMPSHKDTKMICANGFEILAMYPSSLLVRCNETQLALLKKARLSFRELMSR